MCKKASKKRSAEREDEDARALQEWKERLHLQAPLHEILQINMEENTTPSRQFLPPTFHNQIPMQYPTMISPYVPLEGQKPIKRQRTDVELEVVATQWEQQFFGSFN